jgi:hypothetical protein
MNINPLRGFRVVRPPGQAVYPAAQLQEISCDLYGVAPAVREAFGSDARYPGHPQKHRLA